MKRACVAFIFLVCAGVTSAQSQGSGDVWRWIPFDATQNPQTAQIVRNAEYVSIKIEAAHVSYKSGYLENIKQIVVSSDVSFDLPTQKIQALNVNLTWQRSGNENDMPVNDLLAVLSPATPSSINVRVQYAGIGEDRFKPIFDLLSSSDVKTVLNLSAARIAETGLATSILQKFLASPYTSSNPRDILNLSQGFVIYPDASSGRVDSLRQGYIVVISGAEKKTVDLNRILSLGTDGLRFDDINHVLQIKQSDGSWHTFTGNSYVVLSVTTSPVRGIDENSPWFKKFSAAEQLVDTPTLDGGTAQDAKKQALSLWQDGVALLTADPDYIEAERVKIYKAELAKIEQPLQANASSVNVQRDFQAAGNIDRGLQNVMYWNSETLNDLTDSATDYTKQLQRAGLSGTAKIHILATNGMPAVNAEVALRDLNTGVVLNRRTNENGDAVFTGLNQSTYAVTAVIPGFTVLEGTAITVGPRQIKQVSLAAKR